MSSRRWLAALLVLAAPAAHAQDTTSPGPLAAPSVAFDAAGAAWLNWTAPGDDGGSGEAVAHYTCIVSEQDVTAETIDAMANPPGAELRFLPAYPHYMPPGTLQSLKVSGLRSGAPYHAACKASDLAGNWGPTTAFPAFTTPPDSTPPTGNLSLASPTHRPGVPNPATTFVVNWTAAVDLESPLAYAYAVNADPAYAVREQENRTTARNATLLLPEGPWFFHLRAFSQGGGTPTVHYPFEVGWPPIPTPALKAIDEEVRMKVLLNGTRVDVRWILPYQARLPAVSSLEAVEVWRWQDGAASRVASLPGTYGSLAVGVWQDDAAPAHPAYRIVLVFAHGQREQPPDEAAGYLGGEGLPRPSLNVKDPGLTAPAAAPGPAAAWLLLALVALARPRR